MELDFLKIPQQTLDDFFEIIRTKCETEPNIFTSNRNFEDWEQIFGDKVFAGTIIDHIVHHSYIIKIIRDSYQSKKKN